MRQCDGFPVRSIDLDGDITLAPIEPHGMDVVAEHRQRLILGKLLRGDPVLQRLGDADRGLHDRSQLADPIVDHPLAYQRCRRTYRDDRGQNRQAEQQRQLGPNLKVRKNIQDARSPTVVALGLTFTDRRLRVTDGYTEPG